jgi:hypothetical protein
MLSKTNVLMFSAVLVLVALLLAAQLAAQSISGTINGTLVDPSGAVVPGAEATLTSERTSATRNKV